MAFTPIKFDGRKTANVAEIDTNFQNVANDISNIESEISILPAIQNDITNNKNDIFSLQSNLSIANADIDNLQLSVSAIPAIQQDVISIYSTLGDLSVPEDILSNSDIGVTVQGYSANLSEFLSKFTLPDTDGSAGYVLATDGDGNLELVPPSGGGGGGGGDGSVTSVGLSVPTGLSVSGSPVTDSGTLTISYQTGYSIPTTTEQSQWDTAYNWGNHAEAGYLTGDNIGVTVQGYSANLSEFLSKFTLPDTDGSAGYVLATDGDGNLELVPPRGTKVFDGADDPQGSIGGDGDYYINTSNYNMFGPKTDGEWGIPFSLRGNDIHVGNAPPASNIGKNGDLFIDQTFNTLYGPKADGEWPTVPRGLRVFDNVKDHGDVSGVVEIDLRYGVHVLNAVGDVTIEFTNAPLPNFRGVVTLQIKRVSASNAQVTWPENLSFNTPVIPTLVDLLTTVVSVSTVNAGLTYLGYANSVSYEVTAATNATSWNPSDVGDDLAITEAGKTVGQISTLNTVGSQLRTAVRAFGGKSTGKHKLVFLCRQALSASSTSDSSQGYVSVRIGIATLAQVLSDTIVSSPSYFLGIDRGDFSNSVNSISNRCYINGATITAFTPVENSTIIHLLFDFDEGKMWVARNGVVVNGGDPDSGTLPSISGIVASVYFPTIGFYSTAVTASIKNFHAGKWKLMSDVEDPHYQNWTDFQNWSI